MDVTTRLAVAGIRADAQAFLDENHLWAFFRLYQGIKHDATLRTAITPDMIAAAMCHSLRRGDFLDATDLYEAVKDNDTLRRAITPDMLHRTACEYLQQGRVLAFAGLCVIVKKDDALRDSITPAMVGEMVQHCLDLHPVQSFTDLYSAIADDSAYFCAITPSMIGKAAQHYVDTQQIQSFKNLYETVKDDPALHPAITPEMIRDAAVICLENEHIGLYKMLRYVARDDDTARAAFPEAIFIPQGPDTHSYDINIILGGNRTQFLIGCLHKDSLFDLKQHWDAHAMLQRRQRAWPIVEETFHRLAAGKTLPWGNAIVTGDPDKLVTYAKAALKTLDNAAFQPA